MGKENIQTLSEMEQALIWAGAFHPSDLGANLAGNLSSAQKLWLRLEVAFWVALAGLESALVITIWVLYFRFHIQQLLSAGLFWSTILIICVITCIVYAKPILEELTEGTVNEITGVVSKHLSYVSSKTGAGAFCSIEIRNHLFPISPYVYDVIADHQSYRLFYTPQNNTLLNIEPLSIRDGEKLAHLQNLQQRMKH